jgi:hypothetical protein
METPMNSGQPPADQEAILQYFPGEYHVVRRGTFVTCAVTGTKIRLADLRYWSSDLQEAYISSQVASQRYDDWQAGKVTAPEGAAK